ncbi:bifunctional precorrin-2 dehydrogenase/sirohydrochlorin ferrochelatase [Sunxiuqinia elliptica]|uniref:precorrin-2 dehydrogenase n=1 Tax=Sunxiuqinia elliptica TaxID=655355 RepID=A0A4R6GUL6_9BACT|nr:bifunctional precorrin-2 dehydrogenase/sirohydrochlorin ferrochelatase [Sunxiuqinia elliptica]TDN98345.1 precorrin-2 dehydrogenase/sirohydrochlorin ferrochelatase [Sunxiuqinia elliptica]TDO60450.1 precorrin-2 dehydrogenase/sirohydrochlorin ferrochelatase [Sunxiuqinia elliptica]
MEKNFLPIALNIADEKILIVGGGKSAWSKIQILKRFDAQVEVIALEVCDEIKESGIPYALKAYEKADLDGYLMVYSCSNNAEVDQQIVRDGKAAGVLVNIHDQPALCQFVSPAIHQQGDIRVAVSSNAKDVYASIRVRNEIRTFLESQNR